MSLLTKIQSTLTLPDPPVQPIPEPANIIDIDQRDAFIAATLAIKEDGSKQCAVYQHMCDQGMNRATLNAAVKIICKHNDAELIRRYGAAEVGTVELRTASEWAEGSLFKSRNPAGE